MEHYESQGMQPREASLKVIDDLQNRSWIQSLDSLKTYPSVYYRAQSFMSSFKWFLLFLISRILLGHLLLQPDALVYVLFD